MSINRNLLFSGEATMVKVNSVDIGGTMGGVSVSRADDWLDITCDQVMGNLRKKLTGRKMTVAFSVAEISLANLQKAMAMPTANLSGSTLYFTDAEQGQIPIEFRVDAPTGGGTFIYYFKLCYITGSAEHKYVKDGQVVVPVEAEVMADPDNSNRYGYLVDVVVA
jgi:hypothetical protein